MKVPKTEIKVNNKTDPDPTVHINVHLVLVAIVVTNTLPESAKLTRRSVTSVAKKDILHLFVIPDLSLLQDLAHPCRKAMASHNNTNHNVVPMKLMIIQIFNLNVTQRDIAVYLSISCLMKDCILTDLHVDFPHSTSATKIRFKVGSGVCANLLPFKVLKHIEPSVTVSKLHDSIDHFRALENSRLILLVLLYRKT